MVSISSRTALSLVNKYFSKRQPILKLSILRESSIQAKASLFRFNFLKIEAFNWRALWLCQLRIRQDSTRSKASFHSPLMLSICAKTKKEASCQAAFQVALKSAVYASSFLFCIFRQKPKL
ncbi:hypothetical protein D3C86_1154730 [compost metagenome]